MELEAIQVGAISEAMERNNVPASVAVKANGFVFVAGLPPVDHRTGEREICDVVRQTEIVLDNLKAVLETAGSSLEKVVKCTVYITNAGYYDAVNRVYARYFVGGVFPARTFVTVGSWPREFDVEVDAIALA